MVVHILRTGPNDDALTYFNKLPLDNLKHFATVEAILPARDVLGFYVRVCNA